PVIRQRVVHYLVGGIRDKSGGISGMVTAALTGFAKEDFSAIDRDSIGGYIRPGIPHLDEIVKLAGYLKLTDFQDRSRSIAHFVVLGFAFCFGYSSSRGSQFCKSSEFCFRQCAGRRTVQT